MSKAIERPRITQPALSRQVNGLKRELGRNLLTRLSRSVEPTEEELHLVARVADIVELADLTEEKGHGKRAAQMQITRPYSG